MPLEKLDWLGWLSSGLLLLTIGWQIYRQWRERSSQGVSRWLFGGQLLAQIGFILYSLGVRNWVFVVTNSALLVENILGLVLTLRQKKKAQRF